MKKLLPLLLIAVALLGMGGCKKVGKKIDKLLTFYIADDYTFPLVPVPTALVGQTVPVPFQASADATEEYKEDFKAANTAASLVKDVKLDELTLAISSPAGANFDFLERVSFYMSTDQAGTDKVKVASLTSVPRGVSTISMVPIDAKLDKFLQSTTGYYLTVEPTFRATTSQVYTMRINYKFKVTADPL
ncbi:hypothetical protein EJV47_19870 [Hymenobacter gummosus]|uniref:Uncharacterized protein n=1 Tax=Hymenobacter gummosus TaxID=1776032 RepID=A0A431TYS3_9BACT|nr:hypothetical protein [Hymenobacter gummosus]RTQ47156.1 hypothetical protein EJV47_19870 [Hymenobacter gummosus]